MRRDLQRDRWGGEWLVSRGAMIDPNLVERTLPDDVALVSGVLARDLRTGETITSHAPEQPLAPASNVKLLTAALAFRDFGPAYEFETTVHAVGEQSDGQLLGDLVLSSSGAPDLSQEDLLDLAGQVRAAGIRQVSGKVVLDASAFDKQTLGPGWTWDDERFEYGAKSTPIALEGNTVEITITDGLDGFDVDVSPRSKIVRLDVDLSRCETEAEAELSVFKERASDVITVRGRLPSGSTRVEVSPINDPMIHCGHVFLGALREQGVDVDGWLQVTHEARSDPGQPCARVRSAPLSDLVERMTVVSDNFVAEQLARALAHEDTGQGSWDAWEELVDEFLSGLGVEPYRLVDGSGLSRYNLLPASGVVEVLEWALEQPWGDRYRRSLPVAGSEGTVANRLSDVSPTVRAKTGTLTGTRTLSGYVERDEEPVIAFSCLLSGLAGTAEENATEYLDDLVRAIIEVADVEG